VFLIIFSSPEIVVTLLTQILMATLVTNLTYQIIFIMDTIFFWDVTTHKYFSKYTVSCKYVLLSSLLPSEEHFFSYFVSVDCRKTFYSLLNVTSIL